MHAYLRYMLVSVVETLIFIRESESFLDLSQL